jgi:hypothetical protein
MDKCAFEVGNFVGITENFRGISLLMEPAVIVTCN